MHGQDGFAALNAAYKDEPEYTSSLTACSRLRSVYGIFKMKSEISRFKPN